MRILTRELTRNPKKFRSVMCSLIVIILLCFTSLGFIGGYALRSADLRFYLAVEKHKFDLLAGVVVDRMPSIIQSIIDLQYSDVSKEEKIQEKDEKINSLNNTINQLREIDAKDKNLIKKFKEFE
ncbi:hypothetical protein [Oligella urethralis]|uniref:Uncharacterized protein n=1 Tax=Oligella urethralis TaxID=90245 RepID=A0A2X1WH99_9BURK|nr:hypothetical protein [Oligella urethralis]SPY08004.1 Uncharacterised protein [Oligella urethralis]